MTTTKPEVQKVLDEFARKMGAFKSWDLVGLGLTRVERYQYEELATLAYEQGKREGELTGMRNQHEIEKKDRELAKEQGKLDQLSEAINWLDENHITKAESYMAWELVERLKSQIKTEGEKRG